MNIVNLDSIWISKFRDYIHKNLKDYVYLIRFMKKHEKDIRVYLAIDNNEKIIGTLAIYFNKFIYLRGNEEVVQDLLNKFPNEVKSINFIDTHKDIILKKYPNFKDIYINLLMIVKKAIDVIPKNKFNTIYLKKSYSNDILALMRKADPIDMGNITAERLLFEPDWCWLGIEINEILIAVASITNDDPVSIPYVATHPDYRNLGCATYLCSTLIRDKLKIFPCVIINVREKNATAIHVYQKIGFKINSRNIEIIL